MLVVYPLQVPIAFCLLEYQPRETFFLEDDALSLLMACPCIRLSARCFKTVLTLSCAFSWHKAETALLRWDESSLELPGTSRMGQRAKAWA